MKRFVFWMLFASGLGFIKLIILAYIMPVREYGQYVAYFGVATVAGSLLSMGLIEKTIKAYPRQWVTGQPKAILNDATRIFYLITRRFLIAFILLLISAYFQFVPVSISSIILTVLLGLCTSLLALLGSLFRAAGSPNALQNFNLRRSFATLCVVLPAGGLLGWQGALAGEIGANLVGICIGVRLLKSQYQEVRFFSEAAPSIADTAVINESDRGHFQLYFSNLAVMVVTMLDKAWIGASLGPAQVGCYGIVMLIPQMVQLVTNTVVQHIGPRIIKLAHLNNKKITRVDSVRFQAGVLAVFSFVLVFCAVIAKRIPYFDHLFEKFEITDFSLLIAGLIGAGQICSVLEFHLIAYNRERDVLIASVACFFIFIILFSILSLNDAGIEWFIAAMSVSRAGQIWWLKTAYRRYV